MLALCSALSAEPPWLLYSTLVSLQSRAGCSALLSQEVWIHKRLGEEVGGDCKKRWRSSKSDLVFLPLLSPYQRRSMYQTPNDLNPVPQKMILMSSGQTAPITIQGYSAAQLAWPHISIYIYQYIHIYIIYIYQKHIKKNNKKNKKLWTTKKDKNFYDSFIFST